MKGFIYGLVVGVAVGAGGLLYLQRERSAELERARQEAVATAGKARESVSGVSRDLQAYLDAKLEVLELQAAQVQREMAEQGRVIRRKARSLGGEVADATADARITLAIKAKFAADPELSAFAISVSTADGVVTLGGTVGNPARVGRAMVHALETEGVSEVVSTMRVSAE